MRSLIKILVLGLVFCVINVGVLAALSKSSAANEASSVRTTPAPPTDNTGAERQVNRATSGQSAAAGPGIIYAPRDVVDMTRLVLETSRDQTTHLAHYIEHATLIIVVFFSVLGAGFALFGVKKFNDFQELTKTFEKEVLASKANVTELEAEYKNKIAVSGTTLQASLETAARELHREINDQVELVSARVEIEQARMPNLKPEDVNRTLQNAAKRIQKVLATGLISNLAKIRGLADLAYALKRLGDIENAYKNVILALEIARKDSPDGIPLLAYNAACYAAILKKKLDAVTHLNEAITHDAHYRAKAKLDEDFVSLKDDQDFNNLLA